MKNMVKILWKPLVLTGLLAILILLVCNDPACGKERLEFYDVQTTVEQGNPCVTLADFLTSEYMSVTRPVAEDSSKRLYGIQKKDAMARALSICARLKAKQDVSANDGMEYILPHDMGRIIITEKDGDDEFLTLKFVTACRLPFTEIVFVSLGYYNSYGGK